MMVFPYSAIKKKRGGSVFAAKVSNVYCRVKKTHQIVLAVRSKLHVFCTCLEKMCRAIHKKLGIVETLRSRTGAGGVILLFGSFLDCLFYLVYAHILLK